MTSMRLTLLVPIMTIVLHSHVLGQEAMPEACSAHCRDCLTELSRDQIVFHFNEATLGVPTDIEVMIDRGYPVFACLDESVQQNRINTYLNGNGPLQFTLDDVYSGRMAGTMIRVYDQIFGAPSSN